MSVSDYQTEGVGLRVIHLSVFLCAGDRQLHPKHLITRTGGAHSVHVCLYVSVCSGICTSDWGEVVPPGGSGMSRCQ